MREYIPDEWEVVMIISDNEVMFRVAAGWQGGYTYGRSWKLSSTIQKFEIIGNDVKFYNISGSVYNCHLEREGLDYYTDGIVKSYAEDYAAMGHSLEKIKFDHFSEIFSSIDTKPML